jgi:hypothetical protein
MAARTSRSSRLAGIACDLLSSAQFLTAGSEFPVKLNHIFLCLSIPLPSQQIPDPLEAPLWTPCSCTSS